MTLLRWFAFLGILLCCALAFAQADPSAGSVHLTFTPIDVPGSGYTIVWGINKAGDMVGNYGQNINTDSHGFLLHDGNFTLFDYPGQDMTVAAGINDAGLIVGWGQVGLNAVGFTYDGTNFTTIQDGNNTTYADGINNAGNIVGAFGSPGVTR